MKKNYTKENIMDWLLQKMPFISDVEILLKSSDKDIYVNDEQRIGFQKGAKWIRELLLTGEKRK